MSRVISRYPGLFSDEEARERIDVAGETFVRFTGAHDSQVRGARGGRNDPRLVLEKGEVYRVQKTVVHRSHSDLYLVRYADKSFNTVCFEPATREEWLQSKSTTIREFTREHVERGCADSALNTGDELTFTVERENGWWWIQCDTCCWVARLFQVEEMEGEVHDGIA